MNRRRLLSETLKRYFALQVAPPVPVNTIPQNIGFNGAMPDLGGLIGGLTALNNFNLADAFFNFQTSAAASLTLTSLVGLTQRFTNGGAVVVTLDSAYNIVSAIANPYNGQAFGFVISTNAGTTIAAPTLSDTAVSLVGTTTLLAAALRQYQVQITQISTTVGMPTTAGTTFTSLTQVGATNNFTVVLATNTLVPVVGNLIFLTVTAGTLPSGWYPINKVTSATSFVIATPPGTVWTATAATVGSGTVAPPTFSPLLNVTGCWATVTAVISV